MTSLFDLRWLPVTAINALVILLTLGLNDLLAPSSIHLLTAGLLIPFPILFLGPKSSMVACATSGLLLEAHMPVPTGLMLFTLSGFAALTWLFRLHLKRYSLIHAILLALVANTLVFVALTAVHPTSLSALPRLLADLGLSQLALIPLTPWILQLNKASLLLLRMHTAEEDTTYS